MKIVIGGGGTGGHLVPGIALYQQLKKENNDVFYVMSQRDQAYDIVQNVSDGEKMVVELSGISRSLSFHTFKQIYSIFKAWKNSYQQIKLFNPDIMITTGGYLSNIVAISALLMRKPLYILEQNSVAGITNRFWAFWVAKKIFTTFPNPKFIPQYKAIQTGNPLCYTSQLTIEESKKILGLTVNNKPVIGISGGSQGAQKINDMIYQLIPELIFKGFQVVWSLGTKEFDRLNKDDKLTALNIYEEDLKFFRFITRMDAFWSACSLVVARAGAGTISEALLFKTPSLFIPIYQSPDNHQFLNAQYLANLGAGEILEEPNLSKQSLLELISKISEQKDVYKNKFPSNQQDAAEVIVSYLSTIKY